jgi:hypothetical protein
VSWVAVLAAFAALLGAALPAQDRSTPALQPVLATVSGYVTRYRLRYSGVVADEEYRQRTPTAERRLRSDFLLVKTEGPEGWVSFRDVYEVDGAAVRDRDERLKKLFLEPAGDATDQIAKIKEDSARYNIGEVIRNVNVPLFPLMFLEPDTIRRFDYKVGPPRRHRGLQVVELRYTERQRPGLVAGVQASGTFLVEAATGAVVHTTTTYTDLQNRTVEIIVEYRHDPAADMWVPIRMDEEYRGAANDLVVSATATYNSFRRFLVTTQETITIRK